MKSHFGASEHHQSPEAALRAPRLLEEPWDTLRKGATLRVPERQSDFPDVGPCAGPDGSGLGADGSGLGGGGSGYAC